MRKILLVSPHFDDAVLSAGQLMADRRDAEVVTVFGGYPLKAESIQTPYDKKCGFKNAQDAVSIRRLENDIALGLLDATAIDLDFPDSQYISGHVNIVATARVQEQLQKIIDEEDYEFIMAPLGLGHPDHKQATDAVLGLETDLDIYLWEDIPLRIMEPELVPPRLREIYGEDVGKERLTQHATTGNKMAKKIRAMLCYKSQIHTGILDPYIMYVPERFWKI